MRSSGVDLPVQWQEKCRGKGAKAHIQCKSQWREGVQEGQGRRGRKERQEPEQVMQVWQEEPGQAIDVWQVEPEDQARKRNKKNRKKKPEEEFIGGDNYVSEL